MPTTWQGLLVEPNGILFLMVSHYFVDPAISVVLIAHRNAPGKTILFFGFVAR
jgi:hypothetical protein